jgi:hypothetical protein
MSTLIPYYRGIYWFPSINPPVNAKFYDKHIGTSFNVS